MAVRRDVSITRDGIRLAARLSVPQRVPLPVGCVVFVHGLGSGKDSPRNTAIAERVLDAGLATLLFDLSGHGESSDDRRGEAAFVDDLAAACRWMESQPGLDASRLGVAGSSLGAVVAVEAAARGLVRPAAMVLRAPPLAPDLWQRISCATLVIIGSADPLLPGVESGARRSPAVELVVVPGAGHLFEEPGALDEALEHTVNWFRTRIGAPARMAEGANDPPYESFAGLFHDRTDAGARLAVALEQYRSQDPIVLGIPRGGVPVAAEVARKLGCDLDVIVARKLGAPDYPELAIGAVTANGGRFLNDRVIRELQVSDAYIEEVTIEESAEARRREERFRAGRAPASIAGRTVIIVDDGLATGATMRAAVRSARLAGPKQVVVAVPVGSGEACAALREEADEVVCLQQPELFWAVGFYYEHFEPTEDEDVDLILREAHAAKATVPAVSLRAD